MEKLSLKYVDQPSLKCTADNTEAISVDQTNKELFNAAKVRDSIQCQECFKPRYIFSRSKLAFTEKVYVEEVKILTDLFTVFIHIEARASISYKINDF